MDIPDIDILIDLKIELLCNGMRISHEAEKMMIDSKSPIRTRSGASGGLDIILPLNIFVNVPVVEAFSSTSTLCLDYTNELLFYIQKDNRLISKIQLVPTPEYYSKETSDGCEQMKRIGQMCSADRFCYGMTGPGCSFWRKSDRCKFCSIGNNYSADAAAKKVEHLMEVLDAAVNDKILPAKHILLGGGTPPTDDMGAVLAADLCRKIKTRFNISVYVMIAAPLKNDSIDLLYESGVDELGMNLEFWSEKALSEFTPGKYKRIGKKRMLEALEYSVLKFGPINTRSILVAGLEEPEFTVAGATALASIGVMPIISLFRPLEGSMLKDMKGFSVETYKSIYCKIRDNIKEFDVPLGPTCNCCQNNTLAFPFGKPFRFY